MSQNTASNPAIPAAPKHIKLFEGHPDQGRLLGLTLYWPGNEEQQLNFESIERAGIPEFIELWDGRIYPLVELVVAPAKYEPRVVMPGDTFVISLFVE